MLDNTTQIPFGYCHCGCGQKTTIAKSSDKRKGSIKGQPRNFLQGHATRIKPPREIDYVASFWEKVNKDGSIPPHMPHLGKCWEWTGSCLASFGYGSFYVNSIQIRAHRYSWQLAYGEIPNNLWVLHKCDNPKCVNPFHLFLGTTQDNTEDKVSKNRSARGEKSGMHKISNQDAELIRNRYAYEKITQLELGKEFGLHQSEISRIIHRKAF